MLSNKQFELLKLLQENKLKRINILEGSVRSGKTWISLVLWAFWVATMPKDGNYLMVAKTLTSLRRNCLDLLQDLIGTNNFTYSLSKKEGRLFGRLIYLEGVNDARAESKIRGMTLQGAYCDELTLFTEDFFTMLLSRLSMMGAKLISTTNPDSPTHWIKETYIDKIIEKDLDMFVMKFLIDDNIFLPAGYVENLKKEYTGVYYDRFILGLWQRAEGIIFGDFADNPQNYIIPFIDVPKRFKGTYMGYDLGGHNSAYALVSIGLGYDGIVYVQKAKKIKAGQLKTADVDSNAIEFIKYVESKYNTQIERCGVDDAYYTTINDLNAWRYMFYNAAEVKGSMPLYDRPML